MMEYPTVIVCSQYLLSIKHNNPFRNTTRANQYRVLTDARARGAADGPNQWDASPISRFQYTRILMKCQ